MFRNDLYVEEPGARILEQYTADIRSQAAECRLAMASLARQLDTPLVLGVDTIVFGATGPRVYNSAVLVDRHGNVSGRYDKMHPVVFGEYWPWFDRYPEWLE